MDFNALSAVGPGIVQGQQQQALLQQRQIEAQQQQLALDALNRQRTGAAWMGGGGMSDAFNAMNPKASPAAPSAPPTPDLPRGTPSGVAGAPPEPLAAPGATGGMPAPHPDVAATQHMLANAGFDPGAIDGVLGPKTQAALDAYKAANTGAAPAAGPATPDAPGATPDAAPAPAAAADPAQSQGGLDQYDPMQSMRMVMGLADFIQKRYKEHTGQDMDPQTLMEQVQRVAELSNKFTPAQRLGMQGSIAQLRSDTSMRNTDVRTGTQKDIADNRNTTSRDNTKDRVQGSKDVANIGANSRVTVGAGHDAASTANTNTRVGGQNDRAGMVDTRVRDLAAAQNQLKADIAAGRNTTASRNALNAAKARLASAQIQMGKEPTETLDDSGAPAPAPKAAAGGLPAAAAKQLKEGVVTTFGNGQQWTLKGGKQVRVK